MSANLTAYLGLDGSTFSMGMDGAVRKSKTFGAQMKLMQRTIEGSFAVYTISRFISYLKTATADIEAFQASSKTKIISDSDLENIKNINSEIDELGRKLKVASLVGVSSLYKGFQALYFSAEKLFGLVSDETFQENMQTMLYGKKLSQQDIARQKELSELALKLSVARDKINPLSAEDAKAMAEKKVSDIEKEMANPKIAADELAFKQKQLDLMQANLELKEAEARLNKERLDDEAQYEKAVQESRDMSKAIMDNQKETAMQAALELGAQRGIAYELAKKAFSMGKNRINNINQMSGMYIGSLPNQDKHFGKLSQTAMRQELLMKKIADRITQSHNKLVL